MLVKKSYENMINVKPIPKEMMDQLKANLGIGSANQTAEEEEDPQEDTETP